MDFINQLNLTGEGCYAIVYNGAEIYDCFQQKVIYRTPIDGENARLLYDEARKWNAHCQYYDEQDRLVMEEFDDNSRFYVNRIHVPWYISRNFREEIPAHPVKMMLVDIHDHDRLDEFRKAHAEWAEGRFAMFFSNPAFLECVSPGTSKGTAIRFLAQMCKVPMEQTIAAGDSENDLSMIREAGIGCAMANADASIKEAADYVTQNDCDHSGIAEIIHRFMLG